MTKAEIVKKLKQYPDDALIMMLEQNNWREVKILEYGHGTYVGGIHVDKAIHAPDATLDDNLWKLEIRLA